MKISREELILLLRQQIIQGFFAARPRDEKVRVMPIDQFAGVAAAKIKARLG